MASPTIETLTRLGRIIFPRTVEKAIVDDNGNRLDEKLNKMVSSKEPIPYEGTVPRDADTVGGHEPAYFATQDDVRRIKSDISALNSLRLSTHVVTTSAVGTVSFADLGIGEGYNIAFVCLTDGYDYGFATINTANREVMICAVKNSSLTDDTVVHVANKTVRLTVGYCAF